MKKIIEEMMDELVRTQDRVSELQMAVALRVSRKHYNNAIKSLTVCQNTIEALMVELRKFDPANRIAHDACTVLGLLGAMIDADPDMQPETRIETSYINKGKNND